MIGSSSWVHSVEPPPPTPEQGSIGEPFEAVTRVLLCRGPGR